MKKFNPRKCPYKQLLAHKGDATVFVSIRVAFSDWSPYGWREVSGGRSLYSWLNYEGNSSKRSLSCFSNYPLQKREKLIESMKAHDKAANKFIMHIEFHPVTKRGRK